ncbi:MAG: helix-turn-helix domain-containing protein [Eubacteriales bacterium]
MRKIQEIRYIISDASKRLDVEPHVLRYWEEELELDIPRNELGHRYYREEDLMVLENIKRLKEQGFQLKAIKMLLPNIDQVEGMTDGDITSELKGHEDRLVNNAEENHLTTVPNNNKFKQFQALMRDMFESALEENNTKITDNISDSIIKQIDYLLRIKEEREEERFKKLDQTIREFQKMRQETAISKQKGLKLFFKKNNKLV